MENVSISLDACAGSVISAATASSRKFETNANVPVGSILIDKGCESTGNGEPEIAVRTPVEAIVNPKIPPGAPT
jgi:hypothetical protein